jgi:hypothetical protein
LDRKDEEIMKIKVTRTLGRKLAEGDLFSNMGELYWNGKNLALHDDMGAIGQKVYIRTKAPLTPKQANETVYKIEVKK